MKKGSTPKDSIIVVVHVDDLLSVGKREKLDRFFAQLAEMLKIKHIEYLENGRSVLFLGDYITKFKDKITLKSKDAYVGQHAHDDGHGKLQTDRHADGAEGIRSKRR